MDAKQYFSEIVGPTIAEFERNPRSRRHAFLACVATFHVIDYVGHRGRREAFCRESPEFATIDRVAHAFKRVGTRDARSPSKPPLDVGQVVERPPAVLPQFVVGLSRLGDTIGGVTVAGEHHRDLLWEVRKAAEFLSAKFEA